MQAWQRWLDWDQASRGWQIYDYPVDLCPPFYPLNLVDEDGQRAFDDARIPSTFERLIGRFRGSDSSSQKTEIVEPPEPGFWADDESWAELVLIYPQSASLSHATAASLLSSLTSQCQRLSFEIIADCDQISILLSCSQSDAGAVESLLRSYVPELHIRRADGMFEQALSQKEHCMDVFAVDLGLDDSFLLPLTTPTVDLYQGLLASVDSLEQDQLLVFQCLFGKAHRGFGQSAKILCSNQMGDFFASAPHLPSLGKSKAQETLYSGCVRLLGVANSVDGQAKRIVQRAFNSLEELDGHNRLIPLSNDEYPDLIHVHDILSRLTHRTGMILSESELRALVHLPDSTVVSGKLERKAQKTFPVPSPHQLGDICLGTNEHRGKCLQVFQKTKSRLEHSHIIGASGTGKSTLMLSMLIQDIEQGNGVALLDPHGDLVDQLLPHIPSSRIEDVIVFDPSDIGYPVAFNVLDAQSELEKTILASDLVGIFKRFSSSWGDQMHSVLANALTALVELDEPRTLLDLRRFLQEKDFRDKTLKMVKDPEIRHFFDRHYTAIASKAAIPIVTRLDSFLRPKPIRSIVCQRETKLDFRAMMDEGKIFLAKLSVGLIGTDNAHLLGSLLSAKFGQTALSRADIPEKDRKPFFLYEDEFQHFQTPSVSEMLTGVRKYGLGLVLAHQHLEQIKDKELKEAILSGPATKIVFRVGNADSKVMATNFPEDVSPKDLGGLGRAQALCSFASPEDFCSLRTSSLASLDDEIASQRTLEIIESSRLRFGARSSVSSREEPGQREHLEEKSKRPVIERTDTDAPKDEPENKLAGRGGRKHRYLQQLIKKVANEYGYKAIVEQKLPNGGYVDVGLESPDGERIAVEISVSTSVEHEVGNVRKCLDAGFDRVVLLTTEEKRQRKLRQEMKKQITNDEDNLVLVFQPNQMISWVRSHDNDNKISEQIVRGYTVNVSLKQGKLSGEEGDRYMAVARLIESAINRKE